MLVTLSRAALTQPVLQEVKGVIIQVAHVTTWEKGVGRNVILLARRN